MRENALVYVASNNVSLDIGSETLFLWSQQILLNTYLQFQLYEVKKLLFV